MLGLRRIKATVHFWSFWKQHLNLNNSTLQKTPSFELLRYFGLNTLHHIPGTEHFARQDMRKYDY